MNIIVRDAYRLVVEEWSRLSDGEREDLLEGRFGLLYSYNSGKIENDEITKHDTAEVFRNGRVCSFTGDVRTVFELQNLKRSWEQIRELAASETKITAELIKSIHRTLTTGTYDERRWSAGERPGEFKHGHYIVANDIGCEPGYSARLVAELADEITEAIEMPRRDKALTIACYAHAVLVDVHPFADGNGRCARALMNLCLLRCGHPPISIDERDRMAYYGALDAFHEEGDLNALVELCRAEAVKTWQGALPIEGNDVGADDGNP